jgi:hypothetical protein
MYAEPVRAVFLDRDITLSLGQYQADLEPDHVAENVLEAVRWIVTKHLHRPRSNLEKP